MKIHEYQAKEILARYNVRIPRGEVAYTKEEARQMAARSLKQEDKATHCWFACRQEWWP